MTAQVRTFESGATRNLDDTKPDFEGFLSPLVLRAYGAYMHRHRILPNGDMRASDNWQAGIPLDVYAKSAFRHFLDFHAGHRGYETAQSLEDDLCALLFNISGYLHEYLKAGEPVRVSFEPATGKWTGSWADKQAAGSTIIARVPPFVDDEEPGNLKAGEAYRDESFGGTD